MSQVSEATARYHKLIESEPYIDLAWAEELRVRLQAEKLVNRPLSPVLRPHFISKRDYVALGKAASAIFSAIQRVEQMVIANPALLTRLQLLPAERMLAGVEPGFSSQTLAGLLDANMHNGDLHFIGHRVASPSTVVYSGMLADLYYEAPPVKAFRKKHKLQKLGGTKPMVQAILKAYKEFGGKQKKPAIAIVETRAPFQPPEASENALLAETLRREGLVAEVISPEQLDYKNGQLRRGEQVIDIVHRCVRVQDFLVRFDLNHALIRAYKEHAVCMINSFRAEAMAKRSLLDLLTDAVVTAKFPAAERKAIAEFVPWTRLVQAAKTTYKNHTVDLPEFVMKHRAKLVLRPNDETSDQATFRGADLDEAGWEKALRQAMRSPYVVQEVADPARAVFPLLQYGSMVMKEMQVEVHPHFLGGKIHGASSWLHVAGSPGFSTLAGLTPTFMLGS